MCKGQQSTTTNNTSTSTPNPTALAAYNRLVNSAQGIGSTPFIPYAGQQVAPQTPEANLGINNVNAYATAAQPAIRSAEGISNQAIPYLRESAGLIQGAANPLTAAQINQYMSPYTQDVVNATEQQFNLQNAQQQNQLTGNAAAQGALGGNRLGVTAAQLAGQQQTAEAPVIAGLYNTAYNTGLSTAEQEFQTNPETAAYGFGNVATGFSNNAAGLAGLAVSGQNAGLQGAGTQIQAGQTQQQTQQAIDTAAYNYYLAQAGYPEQQLNWESGIVSGVGSLMGGTNTGYGVTQGPTPSMFGPAAGLGIAALGAFAKDGGRIPEYDAGGAAPGIGLTPYGGGNMPYSGAPSYVPALQITHGSGPPKANPPSPQSPQQQQSGVLGGIDPKAIMSGHKGAQNLFGGSGDWAGGPGDDSAFDVGGLGEQRGGRIPHFDTGGAPDDTGLLPPSSGWGMGSFPSSDSFMPPDADQPIQVADSSGYVPRGIRNNNPLNIEDGPFARKELGYAGVEPKGRFAQFNSPESGINAASDLLANYGSKGINTVRGIVDRWAPASDGNDDAAYAGFVAKKLGISPNDPLDMHNPEQLNAVARAMAVYESGYGGDDSSAKVGGGDGVSTRGLPHVAQSANSGSTSDSGGFLGLHLSDAARQGLIGAGLGMMASGSPYPLQQIGQGGLQGLQAYGQAKTRDLAVQRLGIEAQKAQALIAREAAETENLKTTGEMQREKLNLYRGAPGQTGTAPVSPVQVQPVTPPTPPPNARGPTAPSQGQVSAPPAPASGTSAPALQAAPKPTAQLDPNWDPAALEAYAKKVAPLDPALAQTYRDQANKIITSGMTRDINGNVIPLPGYAESKAANEAPGEVQKLAVKTGQDRLNELRTAGQQADNTRQALDLEKSLVNDPNFIAGSGHQFQDNLSRMAVKLGLAHPDRATPGEVYDKLRSSSILDQIRGMKGTGPIRVAEMQFIDKMIAGRENTPQSIRDLVEVEGRAAHRAQVVRDMAQQYLAQGHPYLDNGFEQQLTAFLNDPKNAMFSPEEQKDPRLIAPPVFKNEAQFKAAHLPRGYPFKVQGMDGVGYAQ